jgi:hypothetical protein
MGDVWVDIWHKPNEKPQMRNLVIVIRGDCGGLKVLSVYAGDVMFFFEAMNIVQWAYFDVIQWAYADDFWRSIGLDDEPTSNS